MPEQRYTTRSKPAMVRLSHAIEAVLEREQLPARLYSGFQRLSLFLPEVERYRRLGESCQRVVIWGIDDAEIPTIPNVQVVRLSPADPLARRWFVVAVHPAYTSGLMAEDVSGHPATEPLRDFQGTWTFDADAVAAMERELAAPLGLAASVLSPTRDDMVAQLRHAEQAAADLSRYLERSLTREREVSAARERLSRMIVHDLGGPLTYIGGISELLLMGAFGNITEEQRGHIANLAEQAEQMKAMAADILETYRLESGRIETQPEDVGLSELVAPLAEASGLRQRFEVSIAPDAERVRADPRLLRRVLVNLLANARKYGGRGTVRLSARRRGDRVAVAVADEGPGIPAETLPHVFEPLRQGANAGARTGVGLGLAFVRLAAEAMGGSVSAANRDAGGAELTLELPASLSAS